MPSKNNQSDAFESAAPDVPTGLRVIAIFFSVLGFLGMITTAVSTVLSGSRRKNPQLTRVGVITLLGSLVGLVFVTNALLAQLIHELRNQHPHITDI